MFTSSLHPALWAGTLIALAACSAGTSGAVTQAQLPAAAVSFKTDVAPLLTSSCAGCHAPNGDGAQDQLLFDGSGNVDYDHVKSGINKIIRETSEGAMPKGRTRLTAAQIGVLQAWANAGTPNN